MRRNTNKWSEIDYYNFEINFNINNSFYNIARCQSVDYKKQHELGAKWFGLRLFWDKDGKIEFRHGIFSYNTDDIYDILEYVNENSM